MAQHVTARHSMAQHGTAWRSMAEGTPAEGASWQAHQGLPAVARV